MTVTIPVDTINRSIERHFARMKHVNRVGRADLADAAGDLTFTALSDTTCAVTGVATDRSEYDIRIPRYSPEGQVVVAIGDCAFEGNTACRRVHIPASVISIGDRAFAFCTELVEVTFAKGSRLSEIGKRAFMGCEALRSMRLPSTVLECGVKAFAHCTALESIRLGTRMTTLSAGLLEGCRSLVDVVLPMGLTAIESSAFSSCLMLQSLALPAAVQTVEDCAFAWCSRLSDIAIPARCQHLSPMAFYQCSALAANVQAG